MPPERGRGARLSPTATTASAAGRAPARPALGPPGHAPPWCRAPPAHTARPVLVARCETACGAPIHHPLCPSRAAPAPPRVEPLQALLVPRVIPHLRRNMARRTPLCIPCPVLGQGQAEVEQGMIGVRDVPHADAALAVVDLAPVATPLALHPDRMRAPLGEAAGIKGDEAIGLPQLLDHLPHPHTHQRAMLPGGSADALLQDEALDINQRGDVLGMLAGHVGQPPLEVEDTLRWPASVFRAR